MVFAIHWHESAKRIALKQVYYQGWNRSPAQVGCMGHPFLIGIILSVQFSSVTQSCLTLWDPMDCSTGSFFNRNQYPPKKSMVKFGILKGHQENKGAITMIQRVVELDGDKSGGVFIWEKVFYVSVIHGVSLNSENENIKWFWRFPNHICTNVCVHICTFMMSMFTKVCISWCPVDIIFWEEIPFLDYLWDMIYGLSMGIPGGSVGTESAFIAGDLGSIPGSGRSPGEGNGNTL